MTEAELARHDSNTLLQLLLSADARCDALTAQLESTLRDRALILAERDRLRALPAVQPGPLCECGMTGPCKWTECKAPILSAHVNETPKSEHDAANVLTPAKGDTHD